MPSEPRPKPIKYAEDAPKTHVEAADKAREEGAALPEGASTGKAIPTEGVWYALVDGDGKPVEIDGNPVRVP